MQLPANEKPFIFKHLTIGDDLSQSGVYAINQNRQVFIPIGIKNGLNKYDDYRFHFFQHDPFESTTISKNYITSPLWRTWWAYAFYALAVLGVLLGIRHYELNRIRLKNNLKDEQIEGEKLRELDQIKSHFFANISHEFRTPLTLILGQIDRVLSDSRDQKERQRLEVALRNSRRLLRLINELLDLSKLEAGSMALKAEKHNLIPFLKNLVFSFESLAEQKQIRLQFYCQSDVVEMFYEPDKLEKVFYNLLSNAFKFTPEGGIVKVDVKITQSRPLFRRDGVKEWVEIHITDTGSGISAKQLPHIFDRFYQADNSNSYELEGTGIGLALAKELIELHGGEVSVVSEINKETTFAVRLPIQHAAGDNGGTGVEIRPSGIAGKDKVTDLHIAQEEETLTTAADPGVTKSYEKSSIILVVEDNLDVRAYIRDQLEDAYRVLEAADGEEGMTSAREKIPDLIITDVKMPKMDGNRLCTLLKQDEKTCHIPIIMLTARAGLEDKIAGLERGVDDYLLKPFSARELTVRVRNLIELRRRLRERFREMTVVKPAEITAIPIEQVFLEKVLAAAEAHLDKEQFDVGALAVLVGMSVSQLNRKLRALVDQPAGRLLRSLRLQRAADLLKQDSATVAEICYRVGFGDQANFTRAFKKQFGAAPGVFRQQVV